MSLYVDDILYDYRMITHFLIFNTFNLNENDHFSLKKKMDFHYNFFFFFFNFFRSLHYNFNSIKEKHRYTSAFMWKRFWGQYSMIQCLLLKILVLKSCFWGGIKRADSHVVGPTSELGWAYKGIVDFLPSRVQPQV